MTKLRNSGLREKELTVWTLLWSRRQLMVLSLLMVGVNRASGLVWPFLSKYLVDDVITGRSRSLLIGIVGIGALATAVQGLTSYLMTRTVTVSAQVLVADLRKRVQDHVTRLPLAYYDANQTGALVSRVMNDVEGIRNVLGGGFVSFLGAIATACIAFAILIQINASMTLIVFSVYVILGLFMQRLLRRYRPLLREANVIRSEVTGRLTESLGAIRVVKAYRGEPLEHRVFAAGIDRLLNRLVITTKGSAFLDLSVVIVTGIVAAVVTYLGGSAIMTGDMTLGDFFRYVMFLSVLVAPLMQLVSMATQFNEAIAGVDRVSDLLRELREADDPARSVVMGTIKGNVSFESVTFAYGADQPVLRQISFQASPGTVTALVGPSGAGKSTIIGLIASFYKATEGVVRVDGVDLSRIDLASYRSQLGIVPQDAILFSGTILDNVAFGRPDATRQEIERACVLAHVTEFTDRFERGYETVVGERGITLSMGQRQRIAIARAILADPALLILDEATSSLDSISEAVIQEALSFLLRDRTTFVIAHRLSTIRRADQILVIEDGRIAESGTHESLLQGRGKYWELYTTQYQLDSNLFLSPGEGEQLRAVTPDAVQQFPGATAAIHPAPLSQDRAV